MQQPKPIIMTRTGYDQLVAEKEALEKERPAAVLDLKKAREMGDLSENGYYKSARSKLSSVDSRLRYLTHVLRYATVREGTTTNGVDIGLTVHLQGSSGDVVYTVVGEHEANPQEKKISHKSPMGRALIGKKVGDNVQIITPKGVTSYSILKIS